MTTEQHNHSQADQESQDESFFNRFIVVIGVLIVITGVLIVVARSIADVTQLAWVTEDPAYSQGVALRIRPVGKVTLPGDTALAGAVASIASEPAAPVAKLSGEQVYNTACFACHAGGIGGAPKFGNRAEWSPRVAKGLATLDKHALEGFQGAVGYMPPKGGRLDLSDAEIVAAVAFISGA